MRLQFIDDLGGGAFGRGEQDAVDPMLAHAGDEATLAGGRFRGIGDESDPARLIERIVDSRRKLGVERIGDLADDQPDGVGEAHAQIRRRAMIDIAERVHGRLDAGPGCGRNQGTVAQHQRHGRRRHPRVPGDILHGRAQALPPTIVFDLDRSNRIYPATGKERQSKTVNASNGLEDRRVRTVRALPSAASARGLRPPEPRVAILSIDGMEASFRSGRSAGRDEFREPGFQTR